LLLLLYRFGISEATLRRCMFEQTGGMFPELITRSDLNVFLPPIGGQTVYIFGPAEYLRDPSKVCTVRVHDECNGSDVFGSDICTCRPYLAHGVEVNKHYDTTFHIAARCLCCKGDFVLLTISVVMARRSAFEPRKTAGSASLSTSARKADPLERSPSSSSTTRGRGRKEATAQRPTSTGP
jgi:hypothetical protein